jgi:hypothetical protein
MEREEKGGKRRTCDRATAREKRERSKAKKRKREVRDREKEREGSNVLVCHFINCTFLCI